MKGRLKDMMFGRNGEQILTLSVRADFRQQFDELKDVDVDIEIKKHRERRGLSANAYFHVLVNKIAENQFISDSEVKRHLVCSYGVFARDEDGSLIGFKLPGKVDPLLIYPYVKCYDVRYEGGKEYRCYLMYKRTRFMDSREMARLIDGAIYEAKALGIETETLEELARLKALWKEAENKGVKQWQT